MKTGHYVNAPQRPHSPYPCSSEDPSLARYCKVGPGEAFPCGPPWSTSSASSVITFWPNRYDNILFLSVFRCVNQLLTQSDPQWAGTNTLTLISQLPLIWGLIRSIADTYLLFSQELNFWRDGEAGKPFDGGCFPGPLLGWYKMLLMESVPKIVHRQEWDDLGWFGEWNRASQFHQAVLQPEAGSWFVSQQVNF